MDEKLRRQGSDGSQGFGPRGIVVAAGLRLPL